MRTVRQTTLTIALVLGCWSWLQSQYQWPVPNGSSLPSTCTAGQSYWLTSATLTDIYRCTATNTWTLHDPTSGGGSGLPAGAIVLVDAGTCPSGYTEQTGLNGRTVFGTLAANADVGTTGGADSLTPAGTNSAPGFTGTAGTVPAETFTGSSATSSSVSAGTPAGTNTWPVGVPTAATEAAHTHGGSTVSWPAGVPTAANEAAHTHSGSTLTAAAQIFTGASSTVVVNHVHVQNVNSATTGGTNGYGVDTSTGTSSATGYSTANPTGGSASYTPAGTNGTSAVSGTSGTGSAHTHTLSWPAGVPTNGATGAGSAHGHTLSWPAGVPSWAGDALGTHSHTLTATGTNGTVSFTPVGTVSAPVFTGAAFDNRSAFARVIFCQKD